MTLVWVTGVSGTGKSTLCRTLRARGLDAHDADDGFCQWVDTRTGTVIDSVPMAAGGWGDHIDWVLVPDQVASLPGARGVSTSFLCGTVSNEAEVWEQFDRVVALIVDEETLRARLSARTGDAFGARPEELAAVLRWNATAHETYTRFGATIVDASQHPDLVADHVLAAVRADTRTASG